MKASKSSGASIGVAVAFLLVSCGEPDGDKGDAEAIQAGNATVLVGEASDGGNDALLHGKLTLVEGCVGIRGYAVVWPSGTEVVEENPLVIDVPGYGEVSLGDVVEVGGSSVLSDSDEPGQEDFAIAGISVPAACTTGGVWLAN